MLSRWPIRYKLSFGLAMLCLIVAILSFSGFRGVYSFRELARSVSRRATELTASDDLTRSVARLHESFDLHSLTEDFLNNGQQDLDPNKLVDDLSRVREALIGYRLQLNQVDGGDLRINDQQAEQKTVQEIEECLREIEQRTQADLHLRPDETRKLRSKLYRLNTLVTRLPTHLHEHMRKFVDEVRGEYRALIILTWVATVLTAVILLLIVKFFHSWIFAPLRILITGSRRVAAGDFNHRIRLATQDEVAELADAMNDMTTRFCEIRDDLNRQVRERTKEVVRSEQLASVGFLAAGVAHEINNPLASIAWCAESLESRLHDIITADDAKPDGEHNSEIVVLRDYLRKIQDEAFRCKGITERLLDFSRMGEVERHDCDLRELLQGVIEMVQHLGLYRRKQIVFHGAMPVTARVNVAEIKQVALNLITNALDSLEPEGTVHVELGRNRSAAELTVTDNGCGMTDEVLEHLFEPFFTRRRDGSGTGLGLSISYRIIADHGGKIEAASEGPGRGSRFRVLLPLVQQGHALEKQQNQAA